MALAAEHGFEEVAELLWAGDAGAARRAAVARPCPRRAGRRGGTAAQAALPARTLPLERLQVIVPALAAADPLRLHLDPPAVIAAGRR